MYIYSNKFYSLAISVYFTYREPVAIILVVYSADHNGDIILQQNICSTAKLSANQLILKMDEKQNSGPSGSPSADSDRLTWLYFTQNTTIHGVKHIFERSVFIWRR